MDIFKHLDLALQATVDTAASVVDGGLLASEFPGASSGHHQTQRTALSAAGAAAAASNASSAWSEFDLEKRRGALKRAAEQLEKSNSSSSGSGGGDADLQATLDLLRALAALPDPSHALSAATASAQHTADLEDEVRELQRDKERLAADDAEVARLVEAHEKEKAAAARLKADLTNVQAELASLRTAAGAGEEAEAQLKAATDELQQLQASQSRLRADYEASQSQLFEAQARLEEARGAAAHGADADADAAEEIYRLRAQLAAVSGQRDGLQQQVERMGTQLKEAGLGGGDGEGGPSGDGGADTAAAVAAAAPPSGFGMLGGVGHAELQQTRVELDAARAAVREAQHQTKLLAARLEVAELAVGRLEAEVARRPTAEQHAEAQSAAATLSALLGQQLEREGWDAATAGQAVAGLAADPTQQLQPLLQERVKKLGDALAAAQREAAAAADERDEARRAAEAAEGALAEARAAVVQLEADLLVAAKGGGGGSDERQRLAGSASLGALAAAAGGSAASLPASAAADGDGADGGGGGDEGSSSGMLAVVLRQRDRLTARVAALEEEQGALQARADELSAANARLTADGATLVEKIRYLQSRAAAAAAGAAASGAGGIGGPPGGTTIIRVDGAGVPQEDPKANRLACGPGLFGGGAAAGGQRRRAAGDASVGAAEARFSAAYEAKLNPFAEFRRTETERTLRLHDRIVLTAGSLIAGSSAARAGVVVYLALLHVFIMSMLYARAAPHHGCAVAAATAATASAGI